MEPAFQPRISIPQARAAAAVRDARIAPIPLSTLQGEQMSDAALTVYSKYLVGLY